MTSYDGLYSVVDAWQEPSRDGPVICRACLVKTDDVPVPTRPIAPTEPVEGSPSTVMRQARDTAMANAVKALHRYTCQVCGVRLVLPGGATYAEGAHIHPLGIPHNAPDTKDNVLCLCPNDHVRFDHGAIYLTDDLAVIDAARVLSWASFAWVGAIRSMACMWRLTADGLVTNSPQEPPGEHMRDGLGHVANGLYAGGLLGSSKSGVRQVRRVLAYYNWIYVTESP